MIKHQIATSLDSGRLASAGALEASAVGRRVRKSDNSKDPQSDRFAGDVARQPEPAQALT